jgi:hypothetical protein
MKSLAAVKELHSRSSPEDVEGFEPVGAVPSGRTAEFGRRVEIAWLGTAKLRFSPSLSFIVMTPTTFSFMVNKGPPLFPWEVGAVV